jgi:hypothetical protein
MNKLNDSMSTKQLLIHVRLAVNGLVDEVKSLTARMDELESTITDPEPKRRTRKTPDDG